MKSFSARYQTHRSGNKTVYVETCWKVDGKMHHAAFSVEKHGWVGATKKAIDSREYSQGRSLGLNARSLSSKLRHRLTSEP